MLLPNVWILQHVLRTLSLLWCPTAGGRMDKMRGKQEWEHNIILVEQDGSLLFIPRDM